MWFGECRRLGENGEVEAWRRVSPDYRQKFFSDSRYGGKLAARKAAQSYRDRLLAERAPSPLVIGGEGITLNRKVTPTGEYYAWVATWWDPVAGKQRRKSFGCIKYGWERARELAIAHRRFMLSGDLQSVSTPEEA